MSGVLCQRTKHQAEKDDHVTPHDLNSIKQITAGYHIFAMFRKKKKVGFRSSFQRFAGSHVLIQCISTTTHSLSNQTWYWSNVPRSILCSENEINYLAESKVSNLMQAPFSRIG